MGREEHPHDEIQMDFVCAEVVLSADYDTEEEDMINADSDSSGSNDETQMDSVSAVAPPKPTDPTGEERSDSYVNSLDPQLESEACNTRCICKPHLYTFFVFLLDMLPKIDTGLGVCKTRKKNVKANDRRSKQLHRASKLQIKANDEKLSAA